MTSRPAPRPDERGQVRALRGAFLTRFFDNEITGGSDDLRLAFFSLFGFLAAPALLLGVSLMLRWEMTSRIRGVAAMREMALSSELLYLSYGMVATGLLAAVTWSSLLLDRRDALILGGLPVRPRAIVISKLVALASYLGLLTLAMHGPASVPVGIGLAAGSGVTVIPRGIAAHVIAGGLSSAFLFLAVTSAQGVVGLVTGPRAFRRVSAILQVLLIACVLVGFVLQPLFAASTRDTIRGFGSLNRPWMLSLPPFWFLGTYEWILGTDNPVLKALHWRAMSVLGGLAAVTVSTYLVSYPRLARAAVEGRDTAAPRPRAAALVESLVRSLTRHSAARAAAQFFATSLARVERLRFVVAMAVGAVIGWSIPLILFWNATNADRPDNAPAPLGPSWLLALSLADLGLLLTGLRIAASMPSDLKAAWIIPTIGVQGSRIRSGLWRMLFVMGVVPIVLLSAALIGWFFGPAFAFSHAAVLLPTGAFMVEVLLWNHERMPNVSPWRPERLELGKQWPIYFFSFLFFTLFTADVEALVLGNALRVSVMAGFFLVLTAAVRIAHHRRLVLPLEEAEEVVDAPAVLRLG